MREEATLYLERARWHLANARTIAAVGIPEVAAREAYYAAFHAAEAYIFELTGKIAKTHKGVHGEFGPGMQATSLLLTGFTVDVDAAFAAGEGPQAELGSSNGQ